MNKYTALKRACLVGLGVLPATQVFAHDLIDELDLTVVSATRFEVNADSTTSNLSVVQAEEVDRSQRYLLRDILNTQAGVFGYSTAGQIGQTGSVAIQGLTTKFNQVAVDGFPLSGASLALGNFLANGSSFGYESVEVLRGGQSVNYGSGAVGGVIALNNDFGDGEFAHRISGEIGSFSTWSAEVSTKGSLADLRYNIGAAKFFTKNDRSNGVVLEDFVNETFFSNFAYSFNDAAEGKFSLRTQNSELESGSSYIDTDSVFLNGSVEVEIDPFWDLKVYFGQFSEDYLFSGSYGDSISANRINSVGFDVSYELEDYGNLFFGGQYSSTHRDFFGKFDKWREESLYTNYQHSINDSLILEGGVRYQNSSQYGEHLGYHLGFKSKLNDVVTFRGRHSDNFVSPTALETGAFPAIGFSPAQLANPELDHERVKSFEAGVDLHLFTDHNIEITGYYHNLTNAIGRDNVVGGVQFVNRKDRSEVVGFTTALKGSFYEQRLNYNLAWDYLVKNDVTEYPRNQVKLDVFFQEDNWTLGAGAYTQSSGEYSGLTDAHLVTRIYGSYVVNDVLTLNTRLENVLDEKYYVAGPQFGSAAIFGTGTAFYFGATLDF